MKKIAVLILMCVLMVSLGLNAYLYSGIREGKTHNCVGTYVTGTDMDSFIYFVLSDDGTYVQYTQANGILGKGKYLQEDEIIYLDNYNGEQTQKAFYDGEYIVTTHKGTMMIFRKDSDDPVYINIDVSELKD